MVPHTVLGTVDRDVASEEPPAPAAALATLRAQLGGAWAASRPGKTVSSGFRSLDGLLPAGGVRRGSLIEWWTAEDTAEADAGGVVALACAVASRLARPAAKAGQSAMNTAVEAIEATTAASTVVIVDRGGRLYPPAIMPWLAAAPAAGHPAPQPHPAPNLVVARPSRDDDEIWTIDQALRCPGVATVVAWPGNVSATAMRRLQLAARASGAVGLLIRGLPMPVRDRGGATGTPRHKARGEPTWADARVAVAPVGGESIVCSSVRRLELSLVGGPWAAAAPLPDRSVELFLDLATGREAVVHRHGPARHAAGRGLPRPARPEERACRAS